jgi:phosphatidylserine decarboxylase
MANPTPSPHQYVDRESGTVRTETLFADCLVHHIYSTVREKIPHLYTALTSARASRMLAFLNYDLPFGDGLTGGARLAANLGLNLEECLDPPGTLNTARKVFERKIRYWETRPLPSDPTVVVSPADSKLLIGSFAEQHLLFVKEKFFSYPELLGPSQVNWQHAFADGDFCVCRLTPEKYHYNHSPVSGKVVAIYPVDGCYHSCNPGAVSQAVTPYSKNKRIVTIIDTDLPGGSQVGLVAMIEVVALMIGGITQCYSDARYERPQAVVRGLWMERGQPKSVYNPGSSVDILIFQPGRIRFSADLRQNLTRAGVQSRFSLNFGHPLVETDVKVRSAIAYRIQGDPPTESPLQKQSPA